MFIRDELKTIISGTLSVTNGNAIQAALNHLRESKTSGPIAEKEEQIKEQEAEAILTYCKKYQLLIASINKERYLAEGAEQRVYLLEDGMHVIKLNDAIFYLT